METRAWWSSFVCVQIKLGARLVSWPLLLRFPRATQLLAGLLQSSALAAGLWRGQRAQQGAESWQLGTLSHPGWDQRDEAA